MGMLRPQGLLPDCQRPLIERRIRAAMQGAHERVVIGGLDAEALEHVVAEAARRPIGAVDHQQMIARLQISHQRGRDGGQARSRGEAGVAALDGRHRLLQGEAGGRAETPIDDFAYLVAFLLLRFELIEGRRENRGGAVDRRIDRAVMVLRVRENLCYAPSRL